LSCWAFKERILARIGESNLLFTLNSGSYVFSTLYWSINPFSLIFREPGWFFCWARGIIINPVMGFKAFFVAQSHFVLFCDGKAIFQAFQAFSLRKPFWKKFCWFFLNFSIKSYLKRKKKRKICWGFFSDFESSTLPSWLTCKKICWISLCDFFQKRNFLPQNWFQRKIKGFSKSENSIFCFLFL